MQRPSAASLNSRLSDLKMARLYREMSDDFCYTNGSIRQIDSEILQVERMLKAVAV